MEKDQLRIISLVPSITKMLLDFELTSIEVVGRTKFCIHPEALVKQIPIIGGTKNIHPEVIKSLNPDLVITSKEENVKEQVQEIESIAPILLSDITNLKTYYSFLDDLCGYFLPIELKNSIIEKTEETFAPLRANPKKKATYLIWKKPYMTVGSDTFISSILEEIGIENDYKNLTRYPEVETKNLAEAKNILLSSEPYPFTQKHKIELQKETPSANILLVNGEAFSWYGTHLLEFKEYYQKVYQALA